MLIYLSLQSMQLPFDQSITANINHTLLIALDLFLVSFLIYRVLMVVKGTRALKILIGLGFLITLYVIARIVGLPTLEWILGNFLSSIILVILVLFQEEIRRGLTKMGIKPLFFGSEQSYSEKTIESIAYAVNAIVNEKLGALIVIKREVGLEDYLENAVEVDSVVSRKLILSIFQKNSPLHDGATLVENDRIKAAGCFLPLSFDPDLDPNLGTRHRAALGISTKTDALVIVVSEENGAVSLVQSSKIFRNIEINNLQETILQCLKDPDYQPNSKEMRRI